VKKCLEIIFTGRKVEATRLWSIIADHSWARGDIILYGEKVGPRDVQKRLKGRGNGAFVIESRGVTWDFATVAAWDHQKLRVGADDWLSFDPQAVVRSLFEQVPSFVQGYSFDYEYYHWQNARDLLQFEGSDIDIATLKLVDNGLPSPLNAMVVDISQNPFRRVLRKGYVEMVASRMWLSETFFQILGRDLDRVGLMPAEFQIVVADGLVGIEYLPGDFNSVATASAQNALRRAVYGT
jgi:hypothetical protein